MTAKEAIENGLAMMAEAVAEEREACAKIAESDIGRDSYLGGYSVQDIGRIASDRIANAIRKRSS